MVRRFSLPLTPDSLRKPTVDVIRKRLGGRASTEGGAGEVVVVTTEGGATFVGVVIFVRGEDLDIWVEHGRVRRARRGAARPLSEPASRDFVEIANDARVFGGLMEGQRVRYQHDAGFSEGILIEKCRFGAVLQRDDGVLMGVGFRKIWPTPEGPRN
ncbi:MAG: hypothetical protein HUU21_23840 [Polyangiaceae bacterium]|nr:hypothetical protein [Polyangiaceae bacterium]